MEYSVRTTEYRVVNNYYYAEDLIKLLLRHTKPQCQVSDGLSSEFSGNGIRSLLLYAWQDSQLVSVSQLSRTISKPTQNPNLRKNLGCC